MKLRAYCEKRTDRKQAIAAACGVTVSAVTHWCNGTRAVDPKYWGRIEATSNGDVTIADLLEDASAPEQRAA